MLIEKDFANKTLNIFRRHPLEDCADIEGEAKDAFPRLFLLPELQAEEPHLLALLEKPAAQMHGSHHHLFGL